MASDARTGERESVSDAETGTETETQEAAEQASEPEQSGAAERRDSGEGDGAPDGPTVDAPREGPDAGPEIAVREGEQRPLPDAETCRETLRKMLLIRRFEERAGEMYAKAKIGGFLHLAIGEEAAIVGAVEAMRDGDYLLSTYREHGQALARGTDPNRVMAELFGRVDGVSKGHGGSMHLFDYERRLLGGYGIVGANLPLAVGVALAADYSQTDDAVVCMLGDGAANQGTFGEALNLAALWSLPVVFMVINNQFGMGTSIERHSAVTDLSRRGEGFGVPGTRCNGMDVLDTHAEISEALRKAREDRRPQLVEAVTYRFRGHSMADPEEYRSKEQVEEWRKRDPIAVFSDRAVDEDLLSDDDVQQLDDEVGELVEESVSFADESPFPELDSLYDDIYVYGDQVRGWYTVDERSPDVHRGEDEREADAVAHELAEAGAAYAGVGDEQERRRKREESGESGAEATGEGDTAGDIRDVEGGGH